jgi:hypothetical protein
MVDPLRWENDVDQDDISTVNDERALGILLWVSLAPRVNQEDIRNPGVFCMLQLCVVWKA